MFILNAYISGSNLSDYEFSKRPPAAANRFREWGGGKFCMKKIDDLFLDTLENLEKNSWILSETRKSGEKQKRGEKRSTSYTKLYCGSLMVLTRAKFYNNEKLN